MDTTVTLAALGLIVAAVAALLPPRCAHVDADGQTVLMWATRGERLCGYCPQCERWTRGWPLTVAARKWWE